MSHEDMVRQVNINNIKMIFVLATLILLIALVQKLRPTFSLTYHLNSSKPYYLKAKLFSKIITAVTLYIFGLYIYYFNDLTLDETRNYTFLAPGVLTLFYSVYQWGLTKVFHFINRK